MALFNKKDISERLLTGILNAQDTGMLVVRGKDCRLVFMNDAARDRLKDGELYFEGQSCRTGFCSHLPEMCDLCPLSDRYTVDQPYTFEVDDRDGRSFVVSCNAVDWLDGKPATAIYLRDISDQRAVQKKLFQLAYVDHLTGAPNRQKLKADYDEIAEAVENGERGGVLALFDMDNFKAINDTYGHNTGDIMLKRLVDHLQQDPDFCGHLYRLGGDEFVLLYKNKKDRFPGFEQCREYYARLLQGAFRAYTMPNIELSCTISMGAAFFPEHGTNWSEILRKADIALYKGKESGRNKLVFFEDQYDTAKKFKDLYINIQPILTDKGVTFGYELLDRSNEDQDGDSTINLSEFDRTLDALGLSDIDNDTRYFIAYSNQLMSKTVLNNLPKEKFIIEVHLDEEQVEPAMVAKYQEVARAGYRLALLVSDPDSVPQELAEMSTFIKFDADNKDLLAQARFIKQYPKKNYIATGVDSKAQFDRAKADGFILYQGFFFNEPVVVQKTKDIDPLKINYLRLLKLTSTDDYVNFREIAGVISSDVALSYKLLRLLNSAAVGLRNKISSIDMALAYLGEENLKKWIALLALRGVASDKPLELVRMSLIRARFGELLCVHMHPKRDSRHIFLLGLFSLLHIALEKSQADLFDEIPVADDIRESLMVKDGPHSDFVAFFKDYEYGNWDEVTVFAEANALDDRTVSNAYLSAVKWYNSLAEDNKPEGELAVEGKGETTK